MIKINFVFASKPAKGFLLALIAGVTAGSASAFFLYLLESASRLQSRNAFLLWLLPFAGLFSAWLYRRYGKTSIRGNNLVLEQIHDGKGIVPFAMAPLVLLGTVLTHLFGGSAGREGTAVQMSGSLASAIGGRLGLQEHDRRMLVLYGVCAGFGSVFGTPLAAVLFGLEAGASKKQRLPAVLACLVAAYSGHYTALAWGTSHAHYGIGALPAFHWLTLLKVAAASIIFGLLALVFVKALEGMKRGMGYLLESPLLRGFAGGLVVIGFVYAVGSRDYLGLGLPLMENAFAEFADPLAPLLKLLFTVATVGAGFPGGEVTPLFVIGSTAGSAMAHYLSLPAAFLAALGLAAVFGAAAKTPLACIVLGAELFGWQAIPYLALACSISFLASGRAGIYASHVRLYVPKR